MFAYPQCLEGTKLSSALPNPGFHIACVKEVAGAADDQRLALTIFRYGTPDVIQLTSARDMVSLRKAFQSLQRGQSDVQLDMNAICSQVLPLLHDEGMKQALLWIGCPAPVREERRWRMFSSKGDPLNSVEDVLRAQPVLAFEAGSFMWPGVTPGHLTHVGEFTLETLSVRPLLFRIANFLNADECMYVQSESQPHMRVTTIDGKVTSHRTNTGCFLSAEDRVPLQVIQWKVANVTQLPVTVQEDLHMLHYESGQKIGSFVLSRARIASHGIL
jgi:hypothetical protein